MVVDKIMSGKINSYGDSFQSSLSMYNTQIRKIENLKDNCEKATGARDIAKANKRLDVILEWMNEK